MLWKWFGTEMMEIQIKAIAVNMERRWQQGEE